MTDREAAEVVAHVTALWPFAGRWADERISALADGIRALTGITAEQCRYALNELRRTRDKPVSEAAIMGALRALNAPKVIRRETVEAVREDDGPPGAPWSVIIAAAESGDWSAVPDAERWREKATTPGTTLHEYLERRRKT